jgi:peptidoglycan/LPS O-acetylase OafA/YrhL
VASVLFYFSNYYAIWVGPGIPDGLGVTWSLAVEEHFYIVFPVLAVFLLRFRRGAAAVPLGVICAGILLWRCWLYSHGAPSGRVYMGTDTRVDSILVGCLMALVCNPVLDTVGDRAQKYALPACLAALAVLAATILYRSDSFRGTLRYTVQGLALVPLIYFAVADSQHAAFRWLNTAPMIYLGRVSYTVYLAHESCRFVMNEYWPELGMVPTMVGTAVMALAIAAVMRHWVELPFAGIRKRLHQRRAPPVRAAALVRVDR